MKVKLYSVAAVAVFFAAIFSNTAVHTNDTVGPPGYSGDPTKSGATCANGSSCHGSNVLDGASVIGVKIGTSAGAQVDATSSFVPVANTVYFMTVVLTGTATKYGFSICALDGVNQQSGTFTITNTNQTIKNPAGGIEYVTHKSATSTKSWVFKWKAPATVSGPITFYTSANLANGNGSETGDAIYKRAVTVNSGTTAVEDISTLANVKLYPNPAAENVTVSYNLMNTGFVSAQVMAEDGRVVKTLFNEEQNAGVFTQSFNIAELPAGKYLLHVNSAGKSSVKPFVKY